MLSNEETASFCAQLSSILKAGISALEGISLLMEDARSAEEKQLLDAIYQTLLSTGSLSSGLNAAGVFPKYMVNMTALGEKTGRLDDLLRSLERYYERKADTAAAIRHAVTYPTVMIFMMIAVIAVLIIKVLPVFNQVFSQVGAEMNSAARLLMHFGQLLNRYATAFIAVLCAAGLLLLFFARTSAGRRLAGLISARLPFGPKTTQLSAACQFAGVLSLAIQSGFSTEEALSLADEMNESTSFAPKIKQCRDALASGSSFSDSLVTTGIFTGMDARMLRIGARAGNMDQELDRIANRLDDALQAHLSRMIATIEPTIIVILSIITGGILLSVMLPLLGILSAF